MKTKFTLIALISGLCSINNSINSQSLLKDIRVGGSSSSPGYLKSINNTLFMFANDGVNGSELWKSDGTTGGTAMVKNINPSGHSYFFEVAESNGKLFMSGGDAFGQNELWVSDGTASGTFLVKDINPGTAASNPSYLTDLNGTLFFQANDGTNGKELWKSDGTSAGTVLVKDIVAGSGNSSPEKLINVNGTLFFRAGYDLWKSDGTTAGTVLIQSNVIFSELININGILFFQGSDGELWKSDGTAAGTVLVKDILPGSSSSSPIYLTNVNGTLFFTATTGGGSGTGSELWKSDGTTAGTVLVKDIYPGASNSTPTNLCAVGNTIYFSANDGTNGIELWKSDGTAAGTMMVKDINAGSTNSMPAAPAANNYFKELNGILYFQATNGTSGNELWASDGTATGTIMLTEINPGISDANPLWLTVMNNTLFFTAIDGNGTELWKYNTSTGITEKANADNYFLFPNPSSGKFTIGQKNIHNGLSYEIYNSLGEEILVQQSNTEIDLSNSSKGIYFVRIMNDQKAITKKIIIE